MKACHYFTPVSQSFSKEREAEKYQNTQKKRKNSKLPLCVVKKKKRARTVHLAEQYLTGPELEQVLIKCLVSQQVNCCCLPPSSSFTSIWISSMNDYPIFNALESFACRLAHFFYMQIYSLIIFTHGNLNHFCLLYTLN